MINTSYTTTSSYQSAFSSAMQAPSYSTLINTVLYSKSLNTDEKKCYQQMIDCVEQFGINNDQELFKAAGYCFDTSFSTKIRNIVSVEDYANIMCIDLEDDTLDVSLAKDRPGVFLLSHTNNPSVYFLKENSSGGSLVYYDTQTDQFIDISQLKLSGSDKLVVLNKNRMPVPDAYFATHTPKTAISGQFYHEKQEMGKCAIHACHAFLGYPVINDTALSLFKLENLTCMAFKSLIGNKLSTLPLGQVQFILDQTRFRLAQTGECKAESSNDIGEILMVLKQMASHGAIDSKYTHLNSFEIHKNALQFLTAILPMPWKEKDLSSLFKTLEQEFQKLDKDYQENQNTLQTLREQALQMNNNGDGWQTNNPQYNEIMLEMELLAKNERLRNTYADTIEGFKRLQKLLKEGDRLIIGSLSASHFYAMRKCENGAWAVIDSLLDDQQQVESPLEWLFTKFNAGYQFIALGD